MVLLYWPFGPSGPIILALRASYDLTYWPFGPVWSYCTGPSGQSSHIILALPAGLRASSIPTYEPFGPVWSCCTGPSGQFCPDLLAFRASSALTYWPFGPVWFYCDPLDNPSDPENVHIGFPVKFPSETSKPEIETRIRNPKSKLEIETGNQTSNLRMKLARLILTF